MDQIDMTFETPTLIMPHGEWDANVMFDPRAAGEIINYKGTAGDETHSAPVLFHRKA